MSLVNNYYLTWLQFFFFFFFFWSFCLFRAAPATYGGSQVRGGIRAVTTRRHHNNFRSEPGLLPTPQLMAMPAP